MSGRRKVEVLASEVADAPLEDRELLAELIRALVDEPAKVRVTERVSPGGNEATLTVSCASEDRGKVIGRRGGTIGALRLLFAAIGAADGRKVSVRVSENES